MKRKLTAILLAALLLAPAASMLSCDNGSSPATDAVETDAVETGAVETDAPESGDPETTPPETEAPDPNPYPVNNLTIDGTPIDRFVISCNIAAGGVIPNAAKELREYIAATTGITLEISETPTEPGVKRIAIDETIVTDDNDFKYYSDADGITLAGSAKRSALYAVYHFLENCLGWGFYTADTETCRETDAINLTDIDVTLEMAFDIRDIYWTEYFDDDISVKRYQNGEGKRRKMANGNPESVNYGGVDTFHPYGIHTFAELSGTDASKQPCLNDDKIYNKMLKNIVNWLEEDSSRKSIHVSQNDNRNYCTCSKCQADIDTYGSPAGSIIKLVNRLDEDLKAEGYTDITIITFAYQYSFPCPTGIECNDDIAIELCTIGYCFNHAFDDPDCEQNAACMKEIYAWAEICDEFYLWDYTVNYKYYLSPFPNFDVLLDNLRVMSSIGANGIIEQGNYQTVSGEFGALRCYLLAKALENPNMSKEEYYGYMDAFLEAYYGPGWENIRAFIDFITDLSNEKGDCFGIYTSPEDMYGEYAFQPYNEQLLEWWDKAEAMAENDLQLEHVRRSRLCCDYLRLGAIHTSRVMNGGGYDQIKARREDYRNFHAACVELGITRIAENCPLPETVNYDLNIRKWWDLHEYYYE